jgi:hypothetical protein
MQRSSSKPSARVLSSILAVAALGLAIGIGQSSLVGRADPARAGALATRDCGRVPVQKCHPAPTAPHAVPPQPIAPPQAQWVSPPSVSCGTAFFSADTMATLNNRFGSIECFRFEGGLTWIVLGDGMSTASADSTPGGAMVATLRCRAADAACLDPAAAHSFAGFTVSYPPKAATSPERLQTTFGGRLLSVSDAYCGLFVFDLSTLQWYGFSGSTIDQLMAGSGAPQVVSPSFAVPGAQAVTLDTPAERGGCR